MASELINLFFFFFFFINHISHSEDNKHLLFDYVHLLKNIQNLWLSEKTGKLILKQLCFEPERQVK